MGRDTGSGASRLDRVLWPSAPDGPAPAARDAADPEASRDLDDPDDVLRQGPPVARHAAAPLSRRPLGGWRSGGVPTVAAVAATAAAVLAAAFLLNGGGGPEEVVVGPGTAAPAGQGEEVAAEAGADGSGDPGDLHHAGAPSGAGGAAAVAEPEPAPEAGEPPTQPRPPTGLLVVHVDGAVARPGVVTVAAGSRVSDAVAAAGGVTSEADTRLVNLARVLADGELVVVPVPGEVPLDAGTGGGGTGAGSPDPSGGAGAGGAAPAAPLDLNAADVAALDALPGIGPVLAARIVSHRDEVGPFATVEDLESVSGIGPAVLASIRDLVTV